MNRLYCTVRNGEKKIKHFIGISMSVLDAQLSLEAIPNTVSEKVKLTF